MIDVPTGYRESIERPAQYWMRASHGINWYERPKQAYDAGEHGRPRWFVGGKLNTCFNAIDRHVLSGRGDRPALVYDSPLTASVRRFTFLELKGEVERLAGAIRSLGVGRGDRVVIYMPMVPEAVFAMLACARIGAVHSVVFGGFAAAEHHRMHGADARAGQHRE